jgi:hypothetical protein
MNFLKGEQTMGSIISAHCDCGYEIAEMFLGGGMMDFTTRCYFPHYCGERKTLFEANVFEKEIQCPECGKEGAISYDDERICESEGKIVFSWNVEDEIGRELELTDGKYICPGCGKFSLRFLNIGDWD